MSRFLTKHEIKKNEKNLNEENLLNASKYKVELKDAINLENYRTNIDSAKKKAVTQGMNYDGFHQMVLGANLKGLSPIELRDFKPKETIINTIVTQNIYAKENVFLAGNFVVTDQVINNPKFNSKLETQDSVKSLKEIYRYFKKTWKSLKTDKDKLKYLLDMNINEFEEMINCEILDSDIFLDLIWTVGNYLINEFKELKPEILNYLLKCLSSLINNSNFISLKKFIGKKQKILYQNLKEISEDTYEGEANNHENKNLFSLVINNILN